MVYSAELKQGIGALRRCLEAAGLGQQDARFRTHGHHEPDPQAPLVLVACSGGRDSMALAALASIVCPSLGLRCGALVIDHALQEESAAVSQRTVQACQQLGLTPVISRTIVVPHTRSGPEADARDARYQALTDLAKEQGAVAILLAHTADDQAEGVLIGLMRSSGLHAVAGMAESSSRAGLLLLRPLLALSRAATTHMCQQMGIEWWDDPTNGEGFAADAMLPLDFPLRSRIRHDLLPALSRFAGKNMMPQLAQTASLACVEQDFVDQQAGQLLARARIAPTEDQEREGIKLALDLTLLERAHPALRFHLWALLLKQLDLPPSSRLIDHLDALVSAWHGQSPLALPSFYSATRQDSVILICKDR